MEIKDLLKPRRKVSEEGYPDMIFSPGQIIELKKWDEQTKQWYWLSPKRNHWYEPFFDRFPTIFQKLEWWQERKPEEMPEYVNYKGTPFKVTKYSDYKDDNKFDTNGWCEVTDGKYSYETHVIHTTPATLEEYNAYQSSIKDK